MFRLKYMKQIQPHMDIYLEKGGLCLSHTQTILWEVLLCIKTSKPDIFFTLSQCTPCYWSDRELWLTTILLELKGTSNRSGPSIRQSLISSTVETQLNVSDLLSIHILKIWLLFIKYLLCIRYCDSRSIHTVKDLCTDKGSKVRETEQLTQSHQDINWIFIHISIFP